MFKICADQIIRKCVSGSECIKILYHCHEGPTKRHLSANNTTQKVLEVKFYWPTLFKDAILYVKSCDACQRTCRISYKDGLPQKDIQRVEIFDIWDIDFMGSFLFSYGNRYILIAVEYIFKWPETQSLPSNDAKTVFDF